MLVELVLALGATMAARAAVAAVAANASGGRVHHARRLTAWRYCWADPCGEACSRVAECLGPVRSRRAKTDDNEEAAGLGAAAQQPLNWREREIVQGFGDNKAQFWFPM